MEKLLPILVLFILFFCNIPISFALFEVFSSSFSSKASAACIGGIS
ncbi:hypothetical protein FSEG_01116, partial [Fusobacterium necrophorum D12]